MKKIIVFALLLSGISFTSASAQNLEYQERGNAISFSFNDLTLGSLNGGIGGKFWASKEIAWIISVNLGYEHRSSKNENGDTINKSNIYEIGFFPSFEYHFDEIDRLSPYAGFGLHIFYRKNTSEHLSEIQSLIKSSATIKGISFSPIIGAEYYLTKRISLAGQYLLNFMYTKQDSDSGNNTSTFDIGVGTSSLILSIYF